MKLNYVKESVYMMEPLAISHNLLVIELVPILICKITFICAFTITRLFSLEIEYPFESLLIFFSEPIYFILDGIFIFILSSISFMDYYPITFNVFGFFLY